ARIILWLEDETTLADANYDGDVNVLDMTQIGLIILGRESKLTFIDATGDSVTVNKPVERVIVMFKNNLDLVQMLDVKDKVVAVSQWTKENEEAYPELSELPSIGHWYRPDYEAILTANPDLIIPYTVVMEGEIPVWCMAKITALKENIPDATFYILSLTQEEIDDRFVENFRVLGYILDKEEEAEEFIDWYKAQLSTIKSRTEGLSEDEKTTFFMQHGPDWTYPHPFLSYVAGGKNIITTPCEPDPEWIASQNPEVILREGYQAVPCHGYSCDDPSAMAATVEEEFLNNPGYADVPAVKTGRVYIMDGETLLLGPCHIMGVAYMAKWLHPTLFEDLDPQDIHQEYITRFKRIDYDLEEHGVFVYPPLE
ncbi:MAG: ABC transporter substrate-binding protein, partial [Proteobacteria bacterium]|nr:ABC transporter substrate-binding protein [Pseudomonadota bacterium]